MLRSSAARRERKSFHSRAPLRCVSKHEGECIALSSSFETRARVFESAAPLRYALLRMRTAASKTWMRAAVSALRASLPRYA